MVYVKVNNAVENRQSQDRQISKQQSQGVREAVDLHAFEYLHAFEFQNSRVKA
jgi:hypothetical protein